MFISTIFDYDEDDATVNDYFTGNCVQCSLKIKNRYQCVRQPRPTGGWLGCYCSWNFVRDHIKQNGVVDIDGEIHENILLNTMIQIYEDQMNAYGIYDRKSDLTFSDLQKLEY